MIRLLIALLVGYLGYKLVRKLNSLFKPPVTPPPRRDEMHSDTLVQDPVCKTFIPRREALKVHHDGKDYFFCSEGCRRRFLQETQKSARERSSG